MNITAREASRLMDLSPSTILHLREKGLIAGIRVGNGETRKRFLYVSKSLRDYMKTPAYGKLALHSKRTRRQKELIQYVTKKEGGNGTGKPMTNKEKHPNWGGPRFKGKKVGMSAIPADSVASGIKTRIGNLEAELNIVKSQLEEVKTANNEMVEKINYLVKVWS
jgi:hypothetical protein